MSSGKNGTSRLESLLKKKTTNNSIEKRRGRSNNEAQDNDVYWKGIDTTKASSKKQEESSDSDSTTTTTCSREVSYKNNKSNQELHNGKSRNINIYSPPSPPRVTDTEVAKFGITADQFYEIVDEPTLPKPDPKDVIEILDDASSSSSSNSPSSVSAAHAAIAISSTTNSDSDTEDDDNLQLQSNKRNTSDTYEDSSKDSGKRSNSTTQQISTNEKKSLSKIQNTKKPACKALAEKITNEETPTMKRSSNVCSSSDKKTAKKKKSIYTGKNNKKAKKTGVAAKRRTDKEKAISRSKKYEEPANKKICIKKRHSSPNDGDTSSDDSNPYLKKSEKFQKKTSTATTTTTSRIYSVDSSSSSSEDDFNNNNESSMITNTTNPLQFPFLTYSQFRNIWNNVESSIHSSIEAIEHGAMVRGGNREAQYGRITFSGMQEIFRIAKVSEHDTFLDIGHGIGNACIQAAYTKGCKVKGIELITDRNVIATAFKDTFEVELNRMEQDENKYYRRGNTITFIEGSLTDANFFEFLVDVDVAVCNNAENCFGDLNDYIAILFASMRPGSKLITLYKLTGLGRDLQAENETRKNNFGKEELENASFFTLDTLTIGKNTTSWCPGKDTEVFMYTRIKQRDDWEDTPPYFLCYNKHCSGLSLYKLESESAVVIEKNGKKILNDSCTYCRQKRSIHTRPRSRRGVQNGKSS